MQQFKNLQLTFPTTSDVSFQEVGGDGQRIHVQAKGCPTYKNTAFKILSKSSQNPTPKHKTQITTISIPNPVQPKVSVAKQYFPISLIAKIPISIPEILYVIEECLVTLKHRHYFLEDFLDQFAIDSTGKVVCMRGITERRLWRARTTDVNFQLEQVRRITNTFRGWVKPFLEDYAKYYEFYQKQNQNLMPVDCAINAITSYFQICRRHISNRISQSTLRNLHKYRNRHSSNCLNPLPLVPPLPNNFVKMQNQYSRLRIMMIESGEIVSRSQTSLHTPTNKFPVRSRYTREFLEPRDLMNTKSAKVMSQERQRSRSPCNLGGTCPSWFLKAKNTFKLSGYELQPQDNIDCTDKSKTCSQKKLHLSQPSQANTYKILQTHKNLMKKVHFQNGMACRQ